MELINQFIFLLLITSNLYSMDMRNCFSPIGKPTYEYEYQDCPNMVDLNERYMRLLNLLDKKKINPNATDKHGYTVFHGLIQTWSDYICSDEEPNCSDSKYVILTKMARSFIDYGADVDFQASDGKTSLHLALSYNAPLPLIALLLRRGADVNILDDKDFTPIYYAHNKRQIELLCEYGASLYLKVYADLSPYEHLVSMHVISSDVNFSE